jgi:hypothetical protein
MNSSKRAVLHTFNSDRNKGNKTRDVRVTYVRLQSKEGTDRDLEPIEDITKELCSNLDSSVGIATGYRLAVQGYFAAAGDFSLHHIAQTSLLSNEYRAFFSRQSGRGVKLTRPFTSILRSRMMGLSPQSLYLLMACCLIVYLIKLRDITIIFYQGTTLERLTSNLVQNSKRMSLKWGSAVL